MVNTLLPVSSMFGMISLAYSGSYTDIFMEFSNSDVLHTKKDKVLIMPNIDLNFNCFIKFQNGRNSIIESIYFDSRTTRSNKSIHNSTF